MAAMVSQAIKVSGAPSWLQPYSGGSDCSWPNGSCLKAERVESTMKPRPRQYAGKRV